MYFIIRRNKPDILLGFRRNRAKKSCPGHKNIRTALGRYWFREKSRKTGLYLLGNVIASKAAGTDFKGNGGSLNFRLDFYQIGFPGAAGMIFRMTHFITSNGMFSANIAGP